MKKKQKSKVKMEVIDLIVHLIVFGLYLYFIFPLIDSLILNVIFLSLTLLGVEIAVDKLMEDKW
jgi:succinate-acetate transporter protein